MRKVSSLQSNNVAIDRLTNTVGYDNVEVVSKSINDITTVSTNIADVNTIAASIAAVNTLVSIKIKLESLFTDKPTLDSLFADKATLDSLYADKATLDSLFNDKDVLDSLYTDKVTLDSIFQSLASINRVFTSIGNIDTVYSSIVNVDTTAGSIAGINTVGTNISDIVPVGQDINLGKGTNTASDSAILNALDNTTQTRLDKWATEAIKMTADSYATEPRDAFVKVYTSNGNGTFSATTTAEYSALHYQQIVEEMGVPIPLFPANEGMPLVAHVAGNTWEEILGVPDETNKLGYTLSSPTGTKKDSAWSPIPLNPNVLTADYAIPDGTSGVVATGFTVANGVTLTIPDGSILSVV